MPKMVGERWPSLESQVPASGSQTKASRKNWDKLGKDVEKEEEDEGGVEKLFQVLLTSYYMRLTMVLIHFSGL